MSEHRRGVCINTGGVCEKLLEVSDITMKPRRDHPEVFAPGAFNGLSPHQRNIYNDTIAKDVIVSELRMLPHRLGCAGRCALSEVNIPDFVRRRMPND